MYILFSLIIIAAILLILAVLVQNSKGGGLAANFSGANQIVGVRQTADFIEKFTWGLAIAIVVLSLAVNIVVNSNKGAESTGLEKKITSQPAAGVPAFPSSGALKQQPAPAQQQPAAEPAKEQPAKK
ncbi:preprotein translocase subunit SecG [Acetobacteroides hydrogenigenes]|uniref:Protein-export membrane protein SecG n=1 Tax=Acetobacteroides hydrogenigenes TaxID=979970 RepID=A0A4R2EIB1_9BACT|nr:preprotein translocase subunit SecG [Acetobacteroides hydrogenigenes]TCN63899.1 preprotein translocase subunit SecG [Acetobacteroides hydrogenigenes]